MDNTTEKQIEASIKWLTTWITPIKKINKKFGSYKLKHIVEDSSFGKICHNYVSEESFTAAAKRLGYISSNNHFNMSFKKVLADPEQYQIFYGGSLKPSNHHRKK